MLLLKIAEFKHNQQSQIKEKTSKLQTLSACLRHNLQNTKNTSPLSEKSSHTGHIKHILWLINHERQAVRGQLEKRNSFHHLEPMLSIVSGSQCSFVLKPITMTNMKPST